MKFKSKPHEIDAFQFDGQKPKDPPEWFKLAFTCGLVMITLNEREQHITILAGDTNVKAKAGDWVCKNSTGKLFVLNEAEMHADFEPA